MSLTAAAATFVAVLPAELPDKTILACLILSSRYRPSVVFSGAATAFLAQVVIAVAAGGALSLLPHHVIEACAAGVFVVGAVLLWRMQGRSTMSRTTTAAGTARAAGSGRCSAPRSPWCSWPSSAT